MDIPAKKKFDRQPFLRRGFVTSWMIGTVATWFIGMFIAVVLMVGVFLMMAGGNLSDAMGTSIILYLLILPAGFMMGYSQKVALREHLGINVQHWSIVTAVSWSAGLFLAVNFVTTLSDLLFAGRPSPDWFTVLWITIVTAVPAFVQSFLLRHHLPQIWAYTLSGIVAGLMCGAVLRDTPLAFWFFAPVIFGGLSAMVLMWLTSPTTARMTFDDDDKKKKKHPLENG